MPKREVDMIIAKQGASIAELRQVMGVGKPVEFDHGKFTMTVDMLCAVGALDLPVELPDHPTADNASAWYIGGQTKARKEEDREWCPALAVARFNSRGEMVHAKIFVVPGEDDQADFDPGIMLNDALRRIMSLTGSASR